MSDERQSGAQSRRPNHILRPMRLVLGAGIGTALGLIFGMMVMDDIALGMACGITIGAGSGLAIGSGIDTARLVRQTHEGSARDNSQE